MKFISNFEKFKWIVERGLFNGLVKSGLDGWDEFEVKEPIDLNVEDLDSLVIYNNESNRFDFDKDTLRSLSIKNLVQKNNCPRHIVIQSINENSDRLNILNYMEALGSSKIRISFDRNFYNNYDPKESRRTILINILWK